MDGVAVRDVRADLPAEVVEHDLNLLALVHPQQRRGVLGLALPRVDGVVGLAAGGRVGIDRLEDPLPPRRVAEAVVVHVAVFTERVGEDDLVALGQLRSAERDPAIRPGEREDAVDGRIGDGGDRGRLGRARRPQRGTERAGAGDGHETAATDLEQRTAAQPRGRHDVGHRVPFRCLETTRVRQADVWTRPVWRLRITTR